MRPESEEKAKTYYDAFFYLYIYIYIYMYVCGATTSLLLSTYINTISGIKITISCVLQLKKYSDQLYKPKKICFINI